MPTTCGPGTLAGVAEAGVGWCDDHLDTTLGGRRLSHDTLPP